MILKKRDNCLYYSDAYFCGIRGWIPVCTRTNIITLIYGIYDIEKAMRDGAGIRSNSGALMLLYVYFFHFNPISWMASLYSFFFQHQFIRDLFCANLQLNVTSSHP